MNVRNMTMSIAVNAWRCAGPVVKNVGKWQHKKTQSLRHWPIHHCLVGKEPVEWCNKNPEILLTYQHKWADILKVCKYFSTSPPPHDYYLRELPIEIHSKFIEQNIAILKKILDVILEPNWINTNELDFAGRYYLKRVSTYTQIRVLDDALKPSLGYDECSLALEDAAWLKWLPDKVFIIENQACFLSFPKVKNAVAIFGEGFKSRLTRHIPWLVKTKLFCWFDLDAAGFEMLNMIRQHYPHASSFLMDKSTYERFERFAVVNKGRKKDLTYLTNSEEELYQFLLQNQMRVEQERVDQNYVVQSLVAL